MSDTKTSLYRFERDDDSCFFRWLPWDSPQIDEGVPTKVYQPDQLNPPEALLAASCQQPLFVVSPYAPGDEAQALRIDLHLCSGDADAEPAAKLLSLPVDPDCLDYKYSFQEGRLCLLESLGRKRTRLTFQPLSMARGMFEESPSCLVLPLDKILFFCFDSGQLAVFNMPGTRFDLTLWEMKRCQGEEPTLLLEKPFYHLNPEHFYHLNPEHFYLVFFKVCLNGWFHLKFNGYDEYNYFFSPDLSVGFTNMLLGVPCSSDLDSLGRDRPSPETDYGMIFVDTEGLLTTEDEGLPPTLLEKKQRLQLVPVEKLFPLQ